MAQQPVMVPAWRRWVATALVLAGFNFIAGKVSAQQKFTPKIDHKTHFVEDVPYTGFVFGPEQAPEFPGGQEAMAKFLADNIRYLKGVHGGKVFASFTVTKTGKLTNITIVKSLNAAADNEVIRVLKLSPKWKPGKQGNKPVNIAYTIPVVFENNNGK